MNINYVIILNNIFNYGRDDAHNKMMNHPSPILQSINSNLTTQEVKSSPRNCIFGKYF